MNTIIYILIGIVALIAFLGMIAPKSYEVARSIMVNKSLPEVYDFLKYIDNQDQWSPWKEKDPNMKKTLTGTDGEVGFISAWVGNKEVGEGEQELIALIENEEVTSELRFFKPWKSTSSAYLRVSEKDGGTEVTWGFSGKNKFPFSIFMLFMSMEKSVGKDFELGLAKLKAILEK